MTPTEAGQVFVDPAAYADPARFHAACAVLRADDPIHLIEHPDFVPFHVITKHADVLEIELHNKEWENAPRPVIANLEADRRREEQGDLLRTLIHMDDPDHRAYRGLAADWFLPKNLAKLEGRLAELASMSAQRMVELGGTCDFARDIAMQYPLQVILSILGLPESDFPHVEAHPGAVRQRRSRAVARRVDGGPDRRRTGLLRLLHRAHRSPQGRAHRRPRLRDANATLDGAPIGIMEQISYYVIVATAGHDTTASAMAGGMQALIEHPEQLARLQADPSLIPERGRRDHPLGHPGEALHAQRHHRVHPARAHLPAG
ncbi:MAG: hypothetical protein R2713_00845 [Ilumatobacteraceae bacterium]